MANQFQYREAATPRSKGKQLDHIRIRRGHDGGHIVEHHYAEDGMVFHKPKHHVFGKDEGEDLVDHIRKHMGVSKAEEEAEGE